MKIDLVLDLTEEEMEEYLPMIQETADKYDPNMDKDILRQQLLSDIYLLQVQGSNEMSRELEVKYDFLIKLYANIFEGDDVR